MTPSDIAEIISDSQLRVRKYYPNDCTVGKPQQQTINCIAENMVREHGGKPIHATIFTQAAVLMEGILRLHPFTDGNKRTALLSAARFLYAHNKVLAIPTEINMSQTLANMARATEDSKILVDAIAEMLEVWTDSTLVDGLYQVPLLAPYAEPTSDVSAVSRVLKRRMSRF